jgi:hypothetical protein
VDDPEAAIDEFLGIPALEEEKSDWYGSDMSSWYPVMGADRHAGVSKA